MFRGRHDAATTTPREDDEGCWSLDVSDAVVEAAAAGDGRAFERVYDALAGQVLGYLRSRGAEDAEALTSEVFLAVWPRLRTLTGGAAGLRSLVFSIAHARAVDDVRRRARRPGDLAYEPEIDVRREESAEHVVVRSLEAQRAVEHLADLGEDQRTVIALRIIGDLTLEQTAEVTGKTVASVKQLQRRGLLRLRELMVAAEVSS